ncbi:MAG: GTP-binding protein [Thaumarchaeota archaeon]|nr:MAG: GTP-binding protein [Nitrososphaerota archaeon]TLX82877.1 MAG: GTP-binding protein [Nitrososphaerota archaeon]
MGIPEKIQAIKDEMAKTQINKATEHHVGLLKAKLAKLKREQEDAKSKSSGSSIGFDIKRTGDATVVFIGLPSVGKSTLLNRITGAKSAVAAFQFTTTTVIPGMMEYRGAKIQILDLPGIIKGASTGKGLGKRVLAVAKSADIVLIILDVFQPYHDEVIRTELANIGIRLDQKPPNIVIEKTSDGGLSVNQQVPLTKMSISLLKDILRVYGVNNGRVLIREDIDSEQLVDFVSGNKTYVQSLTVMNKIDLVNQGFLNELQHNIKAKIIPISADADINIAALKDAIYEKLDFIRIYMRPKGGETDYKEPLITRNDSTVLDICNKLHRDMKKDFKYALVWGKSVKFGGQRVGVSHVLQDEDVLTIVKNRGT